ncbi:hypothetical protein Esti_004946 [Eimeria stiedai]
MGEEGEECQKASCASVKLRAASACLRSRTIHSKSDESEEYKRNREDAGGIARLEGRRAAALSVRPSLAYVWFFGLSPIEALIEGRSPPGIHHHSAKPHLAGEAAAIRDSQLEPRLGERVFLHIRRDFIEEKPKKMFTANWLLLGVAVAAVVEAGGARSQLANNFMSRKADLLGTRALGGSYTASPLIETDSFSFTGSLPPAASSRRVGGALIVGFMAVATLALLVTYLLMHCCAARSRDHVVAAADAGAGMETQKLAAGGEAGESQGSWRMFCGGRKR